MEASEILKGAIDIHVPIGPDPVRRRRVTVIPSFGTTKAVTVPITDRDGRPLVVEEKESGHVED